MSGLDEEPAEEQNKGKDFEAREYQVEILEKAIKDNVIVFLPTGSGKTFIAVMLIKQYLTDMKRKYSENGKRVFFLVNATVLVKQQATAIRNLLPLDVGEYTGDSGVDFWDGNRWEIEQDNFQVLVMTAQINLNMIIHNYTDVNQACLLIFDECHQAVKKSPMRQIMLEIDKLGLLNYPKIFGLTATLLNSNVKPDKVQDEIRALETTFHATIIRALNDEMVLQYSANPKERVLLYEPSSEQTPLYQIIEQTLAKIQINLSLIELPELMLVVEEEPPDAVLLNDTSNKALSKAWLGLKDALKISEELGLFGADISLISLLIMIECQKLTCHDTVFRILCSIDTAIHLLRKKLCKFYKFASPDTKPLVGATDKVKKLVELLKDFPETFRAIIFVDRRSTAHALHHIFLELSKHNKHFVNIKSEYIVGVNQSSQVVNRENLMVRKRNKGIMAEFNRGDRNVLFASNVIEEGVDVRACNLVVKFDMPTTFRSYTQSKGRARHKSSNYIIIAPRPTKDVPNIEVSYNKFKTIERVLKKNV